MCDTYAYCCCQYEPDQEFQSKYWVADEDTGIMHCDLCGCEVKYEIVNRHVGKVVRA